MKLHELKSVGSWIDLDMGVVYPSLKQDRYIVRWYNYIKGDYEEVYWGKSISDAEAKMDSLKGSGYPSYLQSIEFTIADVRYPTSLKDDEVSEEWYSKLNERDYEIIRAFLPYLKLNKRNNGKTFSYT